MTTYRSRWGISLPECSFADYIFQHNSTQPPNKPLFIDADHPDSIFLTHESFELWSRRLAAGLRANGLAVGDRVLLFSGNDIFFPVIFMGVVAAGGIITAANPSYTSGELRHQISDSAPTFVIAAEGAYEIALEAMKEAGMPADRLVVLPRAHSIISGTKSKSLPGNVRVFSDLLVTSEQARQFRWETFTAKEQEERTLALNYSSGTTGLSKGVEITHRNYIANTEAFLFLARLDLDYKEKNETTRQLVYLPLYHAMAQTTCFLSIVRGNTVYVMPKFDFIKALENVQRFKITSLALAPPIVLAMVKDPRVKNYDLSSVTHAGSGAAPLSSDLAEKFQALWPNGQVKLRQGWGMTESTSLITTFDPRGPANTTSVGELAPNLEAQLDIHHEAGGEYEYPVGEFLVRGPNIMKGYWRNEKATRETKLPGGWIRTGDVGYFDAEGKVFIVDRLKELIKVKGFQVAPAELEALLLTHDAIADAAVIGVNYEGLEAPRAYVVLKPSAKASAAEIEGFVRSKVVSYKRLTGGVIFVDHIPKNPSGKILRKEIRQWGKQEAGKVPAKL